MPYEPTGRPPGRPRTKPEPVAKAAKAVTHSPVPQAAAPPLPGRETALHMATEELCSICWPDGWPFQATGLGCRHGGPWIRRL